MKNFQIRIFFVIPLKKCLVAHIISNEDHRFPLKIFNLINLLVIVEILKSKLVA